MPVFLLKNNFLPLDNIDQVMWHIASSGVSCGDIFILFAVVLSKRHIFGNVWVEV